MNFTVPPGNEDIEAIASNVLDGLPEELMIFCESLAVRIEDFYRLIGHRQALLTQLLNCRFLPRGSYGIRISYSQITLAY